MSAKAGALHDEHRQPRVLLEMIDIYKLYITMCYVILLNLIIKNKTAKKF